MKVLVKRYTYRNRHFTICKDAEWYLAIEDKYITDGKTNQPLSIAQMNGGKTFAECEQRIHERVDLDHYIEIGMSTAEALAKVFHLEEHIEELKKTV